MSGIQVAEDVVEDGRIPAPPPMMLVTFPNRF
jgi:hypothetical protein